MGYFFEEKALENDQSLNSLEDKISNFLVEDCADDHDERTIEEDWEDNDSDSTGFTDPTERAEYWESQERMLQEILCQTNRLSASMIRREVRHFMEMSRETTLCCCRKPRSDYCAHCLRLAVVNHLREKGFNASLCTSKWKPTKKIPGGRHEYIDVISAGSSARKKQTRYLIELEFRAEFEMAKACDEYRKLTNELPKFFVGKIEHLNAIIRTVCDAAKKSKRETKIYMGPWRKRNFMQMKWSGPYTQRCPSEQSSDETLISSRQLQTSIYRPCSQFSTVKVVEVT